MISQHLIAHRGWRNCYPENTGIAIEKAINAGAKQIEIDIQLNAEHIPYLCHDNHLQRLCNSPLAVTELTTQQLNSLSVYEPERLGQQFFNTPFCSLSNCVQILQNHPHITLFAEIKNHSIEKFGTQTCLAAILAALDSIKQHCVIISFDVDILAAVKQAGWTRVGPVLLNWQQAFEQHITSLVPEVIFCDDDLLTEGRTPADLPFPAAIYEVDNYLKATSLLQQGAQLVETFCIGELIKQDSEQ